MTVRVSGRLGVRVTPTQLGVRVDLAVRAGPAVTVGVARRARRREPASHGPVESPTAAVPTSSCYAGSRVRVKSLAGGGIWESSLVAALSSESLARSAASASGRLAVTVVNNFQSQKPASSSGEQLRRIAGSFKFRTRNSRHRKSLKLFEPLWFFQFEQNELSIEFDSEAGPGPDRR